MTRWGGKLSWGWRAVLALVLWCAVSPAAMAGPPGPGPDDAESKPLGATTSARDTRPTARSDDPWWVHTLRTGGALGAVLALAWGSVRVIRAVARRQGGGLLAALGPAGRAPSGVIEALARYPVGRGATLVLLKLDRRILLVCQTGGRGGPAGAMSVLTEITDPEEVAAILLRTRDEAGASMDRRFREALASADAAPVERVLEQPTAERADAGRGVRAVRGRLQALRAGREVVA